MNKVVVWSDNNALENNTKKTEEIAFDSPSDSHNVSFVIHNETIKQVSSYKYFGVMIDHLLFWKDHFEIICKKAKQRIILFFTFEIMSVLQYCNTTVTIVILVSVCPLL